MKILSSEQIREWDQYTINNEPILSIDLMERAVAGCVDWLLQQYAGPVSFAIFCGKGNNGGDGLAIARILIENNYQVRVYVLETGRSGTDEFQTNLDRLQQSRLVSIQFIQTEENFPSLQKVEIIIDALYGSGLNRKLDGISKKLAGHINNSGCEAIAIDIPSGLFADHSSKGNTVITATHTLSLQCYKLAFLMAENEFFFGNIHILDIGLHPGYLQTTFSRYELLDTAIIHSIYKPREQFAHKGNFGHALIIAGSYGKMGAAVLSAQACLRSGTGLLSCHIPSCGYHIVQSTVPEAMVITDVNEMFITNLDNDLTKFKSIGTGPGIGTSSQTKMMIKEIFDTYSSPVVIDADALNILASQKELLQLIPAGSILTPHPKEFERLFGESANDFDRIELALKKANELNCFIILKGHHTLIATPEGKGFFNSTGNAGMATGGSGDVLTGIVTGLLAQGYISVEAAIFGVYLHGLAGDFAARQFSMEAMTAGDIVENLGQAFQFIQKKIT